MQNWLYYSILSLTRLQMAEALISFSHADAEAWNTQLQLRTNISKPEKRGLILENLSKGIEELWKRYAKNSLTRPPLCVPLEPVDGNWAPFEGKVFFSRQNKAIYATRKWLEWMNSLPLDEEVMIFGDTKEVSLRGKLTEICFLFGCEEADHALWHAEGLHAPEQDRGNAPKALAVCDAHPVEFRALERQLEIATSLGFAEEPIIRIFRQRIENAKRVQKSLENNS